ncbi:transcription initiation factor IID, 18kD subunit-domain-containing protein [Lineolata rhizophorae]|uniref:Transcription initiation factor TFIID subunit 13 n=1 Tax=Lineolata rhizophorae TaxID=578093 RepID=A0A6A6PBJ6_9PEZI|nr:transcription initiation factor IID, 18kD subunit-domain-containing protein [Lineolata rhizophorae]
MAEPRMRLRQKGQQFPSSDLEAYLVAFGDDYDPLPETVRVLDEIITDYIIETCHGAALSASYSRRAKIKVDDFKFTLRRDPQKLGRVTELLALDKEFKKKRKAFEVDEGELGKEAAKDEAGKGGAGGKTGVASGAGETSGDEGDEGSLAGKDGEGTKRKKAKKDKSKKEETKKEEAKR